MKKALLSSLCLIFSATVHAQQVSGSFSANGHSATLTHAIAMAVDSPTEKGSLDVVVVLSNREISPQLITDVETMEKMAHKQGLAALKLVIDPDAKLKSATAYHPAFTAYISSPDYTTWKPSTYNEKLIAGRVSTKGEAKDFNNRWQYDLAFSAPIILDPEAKTIPKSK